MRFENNNACLYYPGIQAVPLEASSDISTPSTNTSESNESASNITDISSAGKVFI